jgi:hypothetical protein
MPTEFVIEGRVVDWVTGKGISGATVTAVDSHGKTYSTLSMDEGNYRLEHLPRETKLVIRCSQMGYRPNPNEANIQLHAGIGKWNSRLLREKGDEAYLKSAAKQLAAIKDESDRLETARFLSQNLDRDSRQIIQARVSEMDSASLPIQTSTDTDTTGHNKAVSVEKGTVTAVSGNDLYVTMADGSLRHFPNVPDSVKVNVDGQMLGVHDLKPGMHLQHTITTSTTTQVVTTTKTVTGKVWHVNPPLSVILTLDDGSNQEFKIPKGQTFMVNGEKKDAWGLKKGMIINATKVAEQPVEVVAKQIKLTGSMPPPPPPPPPDQPVLIAVQVPAPAAAAAPEAAPAALPKTGSDLPTIGLLGLLALAVGLMLRVLRTKVTAIRPSKW